MAERDLVSKIISILEQAESDEAMEALRRTDEALKASRSSAADRGYDAKWGVIRQARLDKARCEHCEEDAA